MLARIASSFWTVLEDPTELDWFEESRRARSGTRVLTVDGWLSLTVLASVGVYGVDWDPSFGGALW